MAGVAVTGSCRVLKLDRGEASHDLERGRAQLHSRDKVGRLGMPFLQPTLQLFV